VLLHVVFSTSVVAVVLRSSIETHFKFCDKRLTTLEIQHLHNMTWELACMTQIFISF